MLINRELWFANPDALNDPFECQMIFPDFLDSIWRHYHIEDTEKNKIEKQLQIQLKNVGICSLSRTRRNQLMWSHYAEDHKGFCIGFNENNLKTSSSRFSLMDVEYQSKLPYEGIIDRIKYFNSIPGANNTKSIVGDILSSILGIKFTNWKYEKEVRLVRPNFGTINFDASAVNSIAFGLRMSDKDKKTLIKLLNGHEWDHIQWYQAEKATDKFGLVFKRSKFK